MGRRVVLGLALIASCAMAGCVRLRLGSDDRAHVERALRQELGARGRPQYVTRDKEGARLWTLTRTFYERRAFTPAWIEGRAPRHQMDALIDAIRNAADHGLDPEIYSVSALDAKRQDASRGFLTKKGFEATEAGRMDAWLTYLFMKFASDLADGLSDLAHVDPAWNIPPEKFQPLDHLERALADDRIRESLDELTPSVPQYEALRKALADYRQRAARGGWKPLPASLKIKPGQAHPHVRLLADRLAASGDLTEPIPSSGDLAFGPELREAVGRFQHRHGLEPDGLVSRGVLARMNVPIEQRIDQIELNLERWRWLPRDPGDRYILVNIPAYRLEIWERDTLVLAMPVVVGKQDTPTPIFSDTMTHLVFSPYWNVPPEIAKNETLPAVLSDPEFLARNNMEVVDRSGSPVDPGSIDLEAPEDYRFRQRPGRENSLGLVKFMFPNRFNVYLHDTPADTLFDRVTRSFSHGCVRVQDPNALAAYVLRDQPDWTKERIEEAMHAEEERTVRLRTPVPVYLGYWTAAVTPDGRVQFHEDVYGIDRRQERQVRERLARVKQVVARAGS